MTARLEQFTYRFDEARRIAGMGRDAAYDEVRRFGTLAGVEVIHSGSRILVPVLPLHQRLGIPARRRLAVKR